MSKRRSPSKISPASWPPTAISTTSCSSASADAIARQGGAVGLHREHRQPAHLLGLHVGRTGHGLHDRLHLVGDRQQRVEIVAEDLDAEIAAHAGDQLVEAHLDGLGELVVVARHLLDALLDRGDQIGLGAVRIRPFGARLQQDEGVGDVRRHRIGRDLGRADLGRDLLDLRELQDRLLQRLLHLHGLGEAGAGDAHRMHGDVALVERGDELAAHARCRDAARRRPARRPVATTT